jgi:hypothetical protein
VNPHEFSKESQSPFAISNAVSAISAFLWEMFGATGRRPTGPGLNDKVGLTHPKKGDVTQELHNASPLSSSLCEGKKHILPAVSKILPYGTYLIAKRDAETADQVIPNLK